MYVYVSLCVCVCVCVCERERESSSVSDSPWLLESWVAHHDIADHPPEDILNNNKRNKVVIRKIARVIEIIALAVVNHRASHYLQS